MYPANLCFLYTILALSWCSGNPFSSPNSHKSCSLLLVPIFVSTCRVTEGQKREISRWRNPIPPPTPDWHDLTVSGLCAQLKMESGSSSPEGRTICRIVGRHSSALGLSHALQPDRVPFSQENSSAPRGPLFCPALSQCRPHGLNCF